MALARETVREISDHLGRYLASGFDEASVSRLVDYVAGSEKVFVYGAGRSGMVGRCFAQRLMHIGLSCFFLGETLTPAFTRRDLLVVVSGSGETVSAVALAQAAKRLGGRVAAVTSHSESTLAKLSDLVIKAVGKTKLMEYESVAPFTSLFDATALALLDGVVREVMARRGVREADIAEAHATVE